MTHWPQLLILAGKVVDICGSCAKAGRERSVAPVLVRMVDSTALLFVLYEGGFFAVWGWSP